MRLGDVLREDGTAQSVGRIVRPLHRLVFRLEGADDDKGAKHLFPVDLHAVFDVGEDGRGDEEALPVDVLVGLPAHRESGAFRLAALDVRQHALVLRLGHLRALEGGVLEGVADFAGGFDLLLEQGDELVVYAVLHKHSRGRRADLARVRHDTYVAPFDRLVKIRIREHDKGGLAARFEGDVFHVHAGGLHDLLPGGGGACESNLVDVQVSSDGMTGVSSVAIEDVDHSGRKAGFFDQIGQVKDAERCLFGGFQDDRVT